MFIFLVKELSIELCPLPLSDHCRVQSEAAVWICAVVCIPDRLSTGEVRSEDWGVGERSTEG